MTNITETNRVAIVTTYYGPTDHRPARIKADAGDGRTVWISYDHGQLDPHHQAALALMEKMGWDNDLICGSIFNRGNVYLMVPRYSAVVRFGDAESARAAQA